MPIGEFSDRTGLSANRLRTYASEGILVPAAVDPDSGYRYYSCDQVALARLIEAPRDAGVPLAEIRTFLHAPSADQIGSWVRQLESEATRRQEALVRARILVTGAEAPSAREGEIESEKEVSVITLRTASRTDRGRVRETNQDVVVDNDRLALVADGMGGQAGGEIAARVAAGVVRAAFGGQSLAELEAAVRAANWAVWDRASDDPELEGMGTTICAFGVTKSGRAALAHVGDSRAYLWREGTLTQMTSDHSVTSELIERGQLSAEGARAHPHYGVLTRAIGVGPEVDVDCSTFDLDRGARLLVCSDGLFNELKSTEISEVLANSTSLASAVDALVERAVAHGGRDNVSVVLAEVAA